MPSLSSSPSPALSRRTRSIGYLIRLLLPAFLLAHGLPRAPFVDHVHTGGETAHTHDLGIAGRDAGVLGRTLRALAGWAEAMHPHPHGSSVRHGLGLGDEARAATAGDAAARHEDAGITAEQRARFRARLAALPEERARPRNVARPVSPGAATVSMLGDGLAWHSHALVPFQRIALTQAATAPTVRPLEWVTPTPSWGVAHSHQAPGRARSPPLA